MISHGFCFESYLVCLSNFSIKFILFQCFEDHDYQFDNFLFKTKTNSLTFSINLCMNYYNH